MTRLRLRTGCLGVLESALAKRSGLSLGRWAEWVALRHLRLECWDIIRRNWRVKQGEIDLIAFHEGNLVFVEVKSLRVPSQFIPEEHLDERKMAKLEELAIIFLSRHELFGEPIRYDLIAVETRDMRSYAIRHYQGIM
ncbi:MAG: YraN family protein [Acidobacteriota bacterium]|nr:MAG: YraN family protein [Acidobacteriota bacterium]